MDDIALSDPGADLRVQNRAALIEMIELMGKFDPSKESAAKGGYADGRYPDFYCPDGRLDIPFLPEGIKNYRQGFEEHSVDAEFRFSLFSQFRWVGNLEVHDCLNPSTFVVFARSEAVTRSGAPYDNSYVFFAVLRDGKFASLREYADTSRLGALAEELRSLGTTA